MAIRIRRRRRSVNSSRRRIGRLSAQAVYAVSRSKKTSSEQRVTQGSPVPTRTRASTRRARRRGTIRAVTAIRNRGALAIRSARPIVKLATAEVNVPLSKTVANFRIPLRTKIPIPRFIFQVPLIITPPSQKYSEDVLDVSETKIKNNSFVPVEADGISSFIPEILQITDFQPIWNRNTKHRRFFQDFSAAGRLIDIQYNTLLLRRETVNDVLTNMAESRRENSFGSAPKNAKQRQLNQQIDNFEHRIINELRRTGRTVRYYRQFVTAAEIIKSLLDIKTIPKSNFDFERQFLSLEDFFQRRMQYNAEQFKIFSNTKILQQLLADFKTIAENYSTNLLGLIDTNRSIDEDPVVLDRTYTLNDGFTFSIEQIRSTDAAINASESSFFNTFLNSLPHNADDRIKLLITILSKEYRVSRGLGIPENKRQLNDVFASGDTGSPFDNIIGLAGHDIFEKPLGPESLLSLTTLALDENTAVLPFERKYIDSEENKKTYVPGSSFFTDSLLNITNNDFNTKPYEDYANQFARKFSTANGLISNLFDFGRESALSPSTMNDRFLSSFRSSIENITNISNINRDQAIIAALFKLANTDNKLKSKLFQFCLLIGLASNSPTDIKPIFKQLASELRTIDNFSEIRVSQNANPSLFGGLKTLRPYLEQLASDIENRVIALTTPTPRFNLGIALRANPQFTRLRLPSSQRTAAISPYARLGVAALLTNQTTVNVERYAIRRVLMSNVDPHSSTISNFIREYIGLVNDFAQAAAYNGETKYLLPDQSGRTRYNFLSTSTQLLLAFEILSSYVAKYSFASFSRSPSIFNTLITIDAYKNDFVESVIDDLLGEKSTPHLVPTSLATKLTTTLPKAAYGRVALASTTKIPTTATSKLLKPTKVSIRRSGNSTRSSNSTSFNTGLLSRINNPEERTLLQNNLSSAYLGNQTLKRIGLTRFTPVFFRRSSVNVRNTLFAVRNKLSTEDAIIGNILNIMEVINQRVRDAKRRMLNIYNQNTLQAFLKENTLDDLEIVRNPTQIRAAAFSIESFINRTKNFGRIGRSNFTFFLDTEIIQPETRIALYSLLSDNQFLLQNQADKRIKIVSVGIPAGFSRQLSERINRSAINADTFKTKQFDVVSVNVYKRDQRFDDIVFKPKSFLFDLSLFQDEDSICITQPRINERFDKIVERISAQDYENISDINFSRKRVTYQDIVNNDRYDFLTNEQKKNLIRNITVSSLLELYIRLLTGLRIEEETFTKKQINPGSALDKEFQNIVFTYITDILGVDLPKKPITDILVDPTVDDSAKDILRLFVFGDLVFEPERLRNQVISPKLFDRIFHIPLNTEEFEIDEELTRETESGKLALEQSFIQERLIRRGGRVFFAPKNKNELVFEDYFVTIENVV